MLEQLNFNGQNKIDVAIERIKMFEPSEGYYVAYSGGKDSECIAELCYVAGVKFELHNNHTTVDPPELVYHIRDKKIEWLNKGIQLEIHRPKKTMWKLIEERLMPPTRIVRYCCQELKEDGGMGRLVITGVRWAESSKRSKRKSVEFDAYGSKSKKAIRDRKIFLNSDNDEKRNMLENCQIKGKNILNPIIDWTDSDVWEFINTQKIKYCKLYDKGFKRLGCVGCPMGDTKGMEIEFKRYPKYKQNYIKAFERMLIERERKGLETQWKTGQEVFDWWIGGK